MVEVFAVRLPENSDLSFFQKLTEYISENKKERIKKFRFAADAHRAILADVLNRFVIITRQDQNNSEINFRVNEYGKPLLDNGIDFYFNTSHSGNWIVCAADKFDLGVDVQEMRDIDMHTAEHFFSKEEYQDLIEKKTEDRLPFFYDLWTLKESYIKALGKGLSIPLSSFTIKISDGISLKASSDFHFFFKQYEIEKGYKLSVCANNNHFSQNINILNMYDIEEFLKRH